MSTPPSSTRLRRPVRVGRRVATVLLVATVSAIPLARPAAACTPMPSVHWSELEAASTSGDLDTPVGDLQTPLTELTTVVERRHQVSGGSTSVSVATRYWGDPPDGDLLSPKLHDDRDDDPECSFRDAYPEGTVEHVAVFGGSGLDLHGAPDGDQRTLSVLLGEPTAVPLDDREVAALAEGIGDDDETGTIVLVTAGALAALVGILLTVRALRRPERDSPQE